MLFQISWSVADFGGGTIISSKSVLGMSASTAVQTPEAANGSFSLSNNLCHAGETALAVFSTDRNHRTTVKTVDAMGRTVKTQEVAAVAGHNAVAISTDGLVAGLYFVRLIENDGQNISTRKLVIN
jgi:hypothetical protein